MPPVVNPAHTPKLFGNEKAGIPGGNPTAQTGILPSGKHPDAPDTGVNRSTSAETKGVKDAEFNTGEQGKNSKFEQKASKKKKEKPGPPEFSKEVFEALSPLKHGDNLPRHPLNPGQGTLTVEPGASLTTRRSKGFRFF